MNDAFNLSGRRAIVTGASRGLGQAFAMALALAGADLILTARDGRDCESFAAQLRALGGEAAVYSLDLRQEESIRSFAAQVLDTYGYVDILVNSAGCNVRKPTLAITWDDWNTVIDTNLRGTFFMCQAFAPAMIARRYGKIINMGSVTSVFGYGGIVPYGASRGGILQMTKALAAEWGEYGINANVLAPGWFKTAQNEIMFEDAEWLEYLKERIPLNRPGQPQDLAGTVLFLASDASEYITGQILLIDGGISTGTTRASPKKTVE